MLKVWILASGESTYATNGLTFNTQEDAKNYANDLFMRWFAAKEWAIIPIDKAESGYLSIEFVKSNCIDHS